MIDIAFSSVSCCFWYIISVCFPLYFNGTESSKGGQTSFPSLFITPQRPPLIMWYSPDESIGMQRPPVLKKACPFFNGVTKSKRGGMTMCPVVSANPILLLFPIILNTPSDR